MHFAKIGFERPSLCKIREGESEPFYEWFLLRKRDIARLKESA